MTKYNKEVVDKAFALFSEGIPIERIGRDIGVSKVTIWKWAKKYDWKTRSKLIQDNALQQSNETLTEIKVRQHKFIASLYQRFLIQNKIEGKILDEGKFDKDDKNIQDFLNGLTIKMLPRDLIMTMKQELLLSGEAEHSHEIKDTEEIKKLCNLMFKEQWREDKKKLKKLK